MYLGAEHVFNISNFLIKMGFYKNAADLQMKIPFDMENENLYERCLDFTKKKIKIDLNDDIVKLQQFTQQNKQQKKEKSCIIS